MIEVILVGLAVMSGLIASGCIYRNDELAKKVDRANEYADELEQRLESALGAAGEREATIDRLRAARRRKPRGVIVTRFTTDGVALDEYPDGDFWLVDKVKVGGEEEAWLFVVGLVPDATQAGPQHMVASYRPGAWGHVEAGQLADIKESKEAAA